jgi:hypothetical protein
MNWFKAPQSGAHWFSVGRVSTFPNITAANDDETISGLKTSCKAFHVPTDDNSQSKVVMAPEECGTTDTEGLSTSDLSEQVLVFQYKSKFYAIDHVSHQA